MQITLPAMWSLTHRKLNYYYYRIAKWKNMISGWFNGQTNIIGGGDYQFNETVH